MTEYVLTMRVTLDVKVKACGVTDISAYLKHIEQIDRFIENELGSTALDWDTKSFETEMIKSAVGGPDPSDLYKQSLEAKDVAEGGPDGHH